MRVQDPREWQPDEDKGPSVATGAAVILLILVAVAVVMAIF